MRAWPFSSLQSWPGFKFIGEAYGLVRSRRVHAGERRSSEVVVVPSRRTEFSDVRSRPAPAGASALRPCRHFRPHPCPFLAHRCRQNLRGSRFHPRPCRLIPRRRRFLRQARR
jgi:hypothetical protein